MIYTDIEVRITERPLTNQQTGLEMVRYMGRVIVKMEGLILFNSTTELRLDKGDAMLDADNIKLNWERNNRKV